MRYPTRGVLGALLLSLATLPAAAQDLRVGVRAALTSPDPASSFTPDRNVALQVWEPLMVQDAALKPVPGLAASWRMRDPTTWEIKLRPGAVFSDGTPVVPEDVAATFRRNMATNAVQTYKSNLREVTAVEAEGSDTVIIRTRGPSPNLPYDLATFGIVWAKATEGATNEDFNGGRAAIGTGPYRLVRWTPGQGVALERNPRYWGPAPHWAKVDWRFIPNDSARTAALLAGELDVIDAVPAELTARVEGDKTRILSSTAIMMLHLMMDLGRASSPYATGADGQPLPRNPLADLRVRQAISMAINRQAIAERALQGTADPAGQFMAPGLDGHDPSLAPPRYDPARARALLAEAGFPQGFTLTVSCTNDRYAGDGRICQVLGQMLGAIGIKANVDAMPMSILLRRRGGGGPDGGMDLSMFMLGYGAPNGLASSALSSLVQTQNRAAGKGGNNFTGYSNPTMDRLIDQAETELDDTKRAALVQQATRLAMSDVAIVPLLFTKNYWGVRRGLTLDLRADSLTFAATVKPQP
jgi:peptide/nickel transport system substrate-binding protein